MHISEQQMRSIEDAWKRGGKRAAANEVLNALGDNVTHPNFGIGRATIEELDRSTMRTIGLYVGIVVGEANSAYELIEKLKDFRLYEVPGISVSSRVQHYLGRPELADT